MTIQEAARRLNKSDLTIRRWIKAGKLAATMVENKWDVPESAVATISSDISMSNHDYSDDKAHLAEEIQFLRQQNEDLRKQNAEKDKAVEESRQRQDTIILQLTRQLDQSQRLLEYHQEPFWKRWFKKSKTPQP